MRRFCLSLGLLAVSLAGMTATAAAQQAATDIADRFARPQSSQDRPAATLIAPPPGPDYEQELLERARAEQRARRPNADFATDTSAPNQDGDPPSASVQRQLDRILQRIDDRDADAAPTANTSPSATPPATPAAPPPATVVVSPAGEPARADRSKPIRITVSPPNTRDAAPEQPDARTGQSDRRAAQPAITTPPSTPSASEFGTPEPRGDSRLRAQREPVEPDRDVEAETTRLTRLKPAGTAHPVPERSAEGAETVTVLLAMEPGDRGIRRFDRTADPILCVGNDCYVSAGAEAPARMMSRSRAFGTANTLGRRAGACRRSLSCVFRGVHLPGGVSDVQPIDLRIMRHDRRERAMVKADTSCGVRGGRLACETVSGGSYRMWIVPEPVAQTAGRNLLTWAAEFDVGRVTTSAR